MSADFLSRWSRRKSEARDAPSAAPDEVSPAPEQAAEADEAIEAHASLDEEAAARPAAEPTPELTEEEVAALPPVEQLTSASDLAPFLRRGVPALVRNAALRRMWSVDPAIRDFLSDAREYAYDWNTPGGAPGLGPLLPSDDVKAMVRRIFDGSAPRAASPEEPPQSGDEALDQARSPSTGEADEAPEEPAASLPDEPAPAVDAGALPAVPQPDPVASRAHDVQRPAEPERRRVRRHGGATPA